MAVKRILLACGTGVVTSTVATHKLKDELDKRGKKGLYMVDQCKVAESTSKAPGFDVMVCTTTPPKGIEIPVINGLCFLTGVGMSAAVDQIVEILGI